MNATLKKRLLRLEKDSSFQRDIIGQEIVGDALRGLSDSELQLLRSFAERGAQLAEPMAEERSAIERFRALYQTTSTQIHAAPLSSRSYTGGHETAIMRPR